MKHCTVRGGKGNERMKTERHILFFFLSKEKTVSLYKVCIKIVF